MRSIVNNPTILVFGLFLGISVSIIAVVVNPLQHGLIGDYFDNPEWQGHPIFSLREWTFGLYRKNVEFPDLTTNFSLRWRGVLYIPTTGDYQIGVIADDMAAIDIGDQRVVVKQEHDEHPEQTQTVTLEQGFYPIKIRYMQRDGTANFYAFWQPPGAVRKPFPKESLFVKAATSRQLFLGRGLAYLEVIGRLISLLAFLGGLRLLILHRRYVFLMLTEHGLYGLLIFCLVFIVHFWGSRVSTSFDSMWTIPTALSMIREKNIDLDEYQQLIEREQYYAIEVIENHLYPVYPLGTSVIAMPFVYVLDRFLDRGLAIDLGKVLHDNFGVRGGIEVWIASFLVAATTVLIYWIGWLREKSMRAAIIGALVFAFCTSAWSVGSRALWQHTASMLLLTCTLVLLLTIEKFPQHVSLLIGACGVALTLSFVARPTNGVAVGFFSIYILLAYRKHFLHYCVWSLLIVIPFVLLNFQIYHTFLSTYYLPQHQFDTPPPILEALVGHLVSPSRGLFIFSPILLFAVYGVAVKMMTKSLKRIDAALTGILLLHWIVISTFPVWWGGHSYGPRYFSDVLPLIIYFLFPALGYIFSLRGRKKGILVAVFCGLALLSAGIHVRGARDWAVHTWNSAPRDVNQFPERVWDWHDIQFLRSLR